MTSYISKKSLSFVSFAVLAWIVVGISGTASAESVVTIQPFGPITLTRVGGAALPDFTNLVNASSTFEPDGDGSFYRWLATIALNRLRTAIKARRALRRDLLMLRIGPSRAINCGLRS